MILKNKLDKFAGICGLSERMRARAVLIFEILDSVSTGLDHRKNIEFNRLLESVLEPDNHSPDLSSLLIKIRKWKNDDICKIIKYIGTYFHLLNQAELSEITGINRIRSNASNYSSPKKDSIFSGIKYLKEQKFDFKISKSILKSISVHPTFTAHPTESRRQSSISKQKKIIAKIDQILFSEHGEKEKSVIKNEAKRLCSLLMMTDEIRSHRISIKDEIKNTINNTFDALWETVPRLAYDITSAFEIYYKEKIIISNFIKFHNWVGGDRDGNPTVTHKITEYAIQVQKIRIAEKYIEALEVLYDDLSITLRDQRLIKPLHKSINIDTINLDIDVEIQEQLKFEPFRLKIFCVIKKMQRYKENLILKSPPNKYSSLEFISDLKIIQSTLKLLSTDNNIDKGPIQDLLIQAEVFGFVMMSLDIREHSNVHAAVVHEILKKLNYNSDYKGLGESKKNNLLMGSITSLKILEQSFIDNLSPKSQETLRTFKVIKDELKVDTNSISSYIISMTHSKSDILEVLLLAKLTGILKYNSGNIDCRLHIVPLFETISDLQLAPDKLSDLLNDDIYRSYLKSQGDFQEIMLGYSDSNKDGGMCMAQYSLYECQHKLAKICKSNQIDFRLFHGRGGSISRGGGKSNKAIISLPPICHNGKIRMTEQGEVISYRYGSAEIAKRHLEQIVNAQIFTLSGTLEDGSKFEDSIEKEISAKSYDSYKTHILSQRCWKYFIKATPINHITSIPIASRPAARGNVSHYYIGFNNLRAIPWVFSWTQLRYNLTGWFGLGTALSDLINKSSKLNELKKLYKDSKFFRQLMDNMSFEMARSRLQISKLYAKTKGEKDFHKMLMGEFILCLDVYKQISGFNNLLERNPVISNSIDFRNPFTDILNSVQVHLLLSWRKINQDGKDALNKPIFMSINAIAAAMQTTG